MNIHCNIVHIHNTKHSLIVWRKCKWLKLTFFSLTCFYLVYTLTRRNHLEAIYAYSIALASLSLSLSLILFLIQCLYQNKPLFCKKKRTNRFNSPSIMFVLWHCTYLSQTSKENEFQLKRLPRLWHTSVAY